MRKLRTKISIVVALMMLAGLMVVPVSASNDVYLSGGDTLIVSGPLDGNIKANSTWTGWILLGNGAFVDGNIEIDDYASGDVTMDAVSTLNGNLINKGSGAVDVHNGGTKIDGNVYSYSGPCQVEDAVMNSGNLEGTCGVEGHSDP